MIDNSDLNRLLSTLLKASDPNVFTKLEFDRCNYDILRKINNGIQLNRIIYVSLFIQLIFKLIF